MSIKLSEEKIESFAECKKITALGARYTLMSGSGPSVFGIFPKDGEAAEIAKSALEAQGIPAWLCSPAE